MAKNKRKNEENNIDFLLRPAAWDDYIGQDKIKKSLRVILAAAKKRNEPSDHLLFYGQAGLGKTTLATLVAREMDASFKVATGPTLEKIGDVVAVLSSLEPNDILFIDEAHRLNRQIEEALYPAMEERKVYVIIGKGPGGRIITLDLPPFTLIAATTRANLVSSPLRSRFGAIFQLDYYEPGEIEKIIFRSAEILKTTLKPSAASIIAKASRFTPRTANRLLKRCRDFAEVNSLKMIDEETALKTLDLLSIDELGLEAFDRRILEIIIKKFRGGPVGINAFAAALNEDRDAIEEIYEPYLIKLGFLQRTPKGRVVTKEAKTHLYGNK